MRDPQETAKRLLEKRAELLRTSARQIVHATVGERVMALLRTADAVSREDLIASFEADVALVADPSKREHNADAVRAEEAIIALRSLRGD